MQRRDLLWLFAAAPLGAAARAAASDQALVTHTDAEWHARLTSAQYDVLRQQGTEIPFSSPLDHEARAGRYRCAGCDLPVFESSTKYDSGTGWPSFWAPLPHAVATRDDGSFGMERTEVHCSRCMSHLGHLFDDGPQPTGLRYCMDGVALTFHPQGGIKS